MNSDTRGKLAATGGVFGALLASSCCVLPLILITLGASGAWIGTLTAFKTYQPLFVGAAVAFLGYGFWQVYWRPTCDDTACATRKSQRIVKVALWSALLMTSVAATTDLWAPLFY